MDRNNIKIVFDTPQYIVDEVNKVVICRLTCNIKCPYLLMSIYDYFPCYNSIISKTFKGVAKAKDGDVFDVNIGKKVSLAKAENKIYREASKYFDRHYQDMRKAMRAIVNFNDKCDRVIKHNVSYMSKF